MSSSSSLYTPDEDSGGVLRHNDQQQQQLSSSSSSTSHLISGSGGGVAIESSSLPLPSISLTSQNLSSAAAAIASPPPQPPHSTTLFVPYRYTVDTSGSGKFRIFTRSNNDNSTTRKVFTLDVQSWSYLNIPLSNVDLASRTVDILRDELSTDRVSYDETTKHFIVEPSDSVTARVREVAREIIRVPLTPASVLSRFGHRFFDPLQENGRWASATSTTSSASPTTKASFHTIAWSVIDDNTIAFVKQGYATTYSSSPSSSTVHIWTTYQTFAGDQHSEAAVVELCGGSTDLLDISVKTFHTRHELTSEFIALLSADTDIAIHYGEKDSTIGGEVIRKFNGGGSNNSTTNLEMFDIRDFVEHVYTDIASHEFISIISELDIHSGDVVAEASCASLSSSSSDGGGGSGGGCSSVASSVSLPDLRTTVHSPENIVYFLEKITARAYLLLRLYSKLSKSIFDLCYFSGCNMSNLTTKENAARGVVTFIDPIAAWSQIVDTLPHDYMSSGLHGLTHVTPFAGILIENMMTSDHTLTSLIASKIMPLKNYWWIIREIFSLRALSPLPVLDNPSVFGIFRGMIYSTREIPGHESSRQWSSILNVGLESWIGVSMTLSPSSPSSSSSLSHPTIGDGSTITFGYFGIEDACRHPFDAMRTSVEMYLSLKICSNSTASPRTVAATTALTTENMAVRRRITAANIATYKALLPPDEVAIIASGAKDSVINLWYRSHDKYTTNPLLADRKVYTLMIEGMLTRTFNFIFTPPPPPSAHHQQTQPPSSLLLSQQQQQSQSPPPPPPSPTTPPNPQSQQLSLLKNSSYPPPPPPVSVDIQAGGDRVFPAFKCPARF